MNVKYKLKSGSALREAICNEDIKQTAECLRNCCIELNRKLRGEDKSDYALDLDDMYVSLECYEFGNDEEDEENINCYLADFYDICDSVGAWIEI